MVASGRMPKLEMQENLRKFEIEAKKLLNKTGADHVVFGVKQFAEDGKLQEIRFYTKAMDDNEFYSRTGGLHNCQVYALHKMS